VAAGAVPTVIGFRSTPCSRKRLDGDDVLGVGPVGGDLRNFKHTVFPADASLTSAGRERLLRGGARASPLVSLPFDKSLAPNSTFWTWCCDAIAYWRRLDSHHPSGGSSRAAISAAITLRVLGHNHGGYWRWSDGSRSGLACSRPARSAACVGGVNDEPKVAAAAAVRAPPREKPECCCCAGRLRRTNCFSNRQQLSVSASDHPREIGQRAFAAAMVLGNVDQKRHHQRVRFVGPGKIVGVGAASILHSPATHDGVLAMVRGAHLSSFAFRPRLWLPGEKVAKSHFVSARASHASVAFSSS